MKRYRGFGAMGRTLAAGALLALGVAGCEKAAGDQKKPAAMPARPPAPVTVAVAEARDVPVYLDEIGRTMAIRTVSIVPQVGGKVVAAHVEDGASVVKGQLLFEIDPRPIEAAVASAQAALLQAKAELGLARNEFERIQGLEKTNAVSKQEFDQRRSGVEVAEAKGAAAEAALETTKLNLAYAKIYSPLDGRAGALLVDPGNVVKENDKALLVIQTLDPIYAEFTVTENDLGTVRKYLATAGLDKGLEPHKGLKVEVDVPGDSKAILSALGNPTTQPATTQPATTQPGRPPVGPRVGTLTFLDNAVQDGAGTVRLRATVANPDHYFWPGQFVNVRVVLTTAKDAVLIPSQAVQVGQQGPFVYVVNAGKAELRPIVPGQRQGDRVVVRKGVEGGEKVILTGQMMVMPGGPVNVTNDKPPEPPGVGKDSANE